MQIRKFKRQTCLKGERDELQIESLTNSEALETRHPTPPGTSQTPQNHTQEEPLAAPGERHEILAAALARPLKPIPKEVPTPKKRRAAWKARTLNPIGFKRADLGLSDLGLNGSNDL